MNLSFPILSALVFIPAISGVLLMFMPKSSRDLIRGISIMTSAVVLVLAATVFFTYNNLVASDTGVFTNQYDETAGIFVGDSLVPAGVGITTATQAYADALVFEEYVPWISSLGISWHLGVDGLTTPLVLLTGMVAVAGVLISWRIEDRLREFMAFFQLLVSGVMAVFISVDMFMLFFFYELAIFPMYILIAGWGWVKLREYASMKLTLYILIGSVVALVGALAMYFVAGNYFSNEGALVLRSAIDSGLLPQSAHPFSFDMVQLTLAAENGAFSAPGYLGSDILTFSKFWFPFMFIGFAVLAGVFPFHNWSPDGHVAAPTAVSMIHAGVLMKLGAYAALRTSVQLMPTGAHVHLPWIIFLTLINVVYGAFIAFRQRDFKYVIGFSSVSHMGLVSMGWATMNLTGMTGAGLQMFSHGAMTALFFGCVGMVYERAHTRDIPSLGGFMKRMPWVGVAFIIGGLTSMGMPGFSGFIAEFPIFQGLWRASDKVSLALGNFHLSNYYSIIAIVASLGIIVTVAYVLRVTAHVFFGEFDETKYADVGDIAITDRIILILLGGPLIIIGLYPQIIQPMISSGLKPIVAMLNGGM